ncbi:hypothetical protein Hypma_010824 [Hypsizygus marmoreus]|uniref:Putative gamma-glutamylcyclotransferase n=1 Tax=Hypsizygus marmoreus TaxID=39966 RepID=A0A369JKF7_HYPMA|nr:hypothetical protein Hypma_010824 [Hypsizygus marmoreus]
MHMDDYIEEPSPWVQLESKSPGQLDFTPKPRVQPAPVSFRPEFEDHLLFFYGTLTLPHFLKAILSLSDSPILTPAHITGFLLKMWGPYPALVPTRDSGDGDRVNGWAYVVKTEHHLTRLKIYETENYKLAPCTVMLEGGEAKDGWTFIWNGYPEELKDGTFTPNSVALQGLGHKDSINALPPDPWFSPL